MRLVSWNVNGLRAVMKKGFMDAFNELNADVFAVQETKLQEGQIEMDLPGYHAMRSEKVIRVLRYFAKRSHCGSCTRWVFLNSIPKGALLSANSRSTGL